MKYPILSFISGLSFGGIFAFFKLPIPAPNTFSGLLGIIGLFVGYMLVQRFLGPWSVSILSCTYEIILKLFLSSLKDHLSSHLK